MPEAKTVLLKIVRNKNTLFFKFFLVHIKFYIDKVDIVW